MFQTIKSSKVLIGIAIVVVGFVILVAVAGIIGTDNSGEVDSLNKQVSNLQKSLSDRNQQIDRLVSRNAQLKKQVGPIKSYASKIKALAQQKGSLESQVGSLQSQVQDEQAQLQSTKAAVSRSTFGNGTWAVGPDIEPGTYRAPGGHACYWAILRDTNTNHIVDNGVDVSNPTVTLDEGRYFESDDCGTWGPGP